MSKEIKIDKFNKKLQKYHLKYIASLKPEQRVMHDLNFQYLSDMICKGYAIITIDDIDKKLKEHGVI